MKNNNVWTEQRVKRATPLVLFIGVVLRVALALVNSEANDNHLKVSKIIADENRIPEDDCQPPPGNCPVYEAFQPKLYHVTVALLWKIIPNQSLPIRTRAAQLLSCAAGILTLLLVLRFCMQASGGSAKVRIYSFSLVALNPDLIGINAQATNDSFVILFATMALYFGYRFFESRQVTDLSWMIISAVLATLSKGNGLVVSIAILAVFAVAFLRRGHGYSMTRRQAVLYGLVFFVSFVTVVVALGPYREHYVRHGTPFWAGAPPPPFPKLLERTSYSSDNGAFAGVPGVRSIADSLLTFRFFDMLRTPVMTNDPENVVVPDEYPKHRTSLWSQLYGRAHFVHFEPWPASWRLPVRDELRWLTSLVWNLGRLIFLCALFPTALLALGICKKAVSSIRWMFGGAKNEYQGLGDWLFALSAFGYLAFIVLYSLRFRDYTLMKPIFIFPSLLAFLMIFMRECEKFYGWCNQIKAIRLCADTTFVLLFVFYTADIVALIAQLSIRLFLYGA